jgi:DNA polymerase-3 subunit beta
MIVKVDRDLLRIRGEQVSHFLNRDSGDVTSHLYLWAEGERLILKGTDWDMGLSTSISAQVVEEGEVVVDGRRFITLLKASSGNEVELKREGEELVLKGERGVFRLQLPQFEEYPRFPVVEGGDSLQPADQFLIGLKKVIPAVAKNHVRYELNCILIDAGEGVNIVGTDTIRMAIYQLSKEQVAEKQLLLPQKSVVELMRIFTDDMEIIYNNKYLVARNDNSYFFTKIVDGKFPPYRQIIPTNFSYTTTFEKQGVLKAVKQLSIVSNEISVELTENGMRLEAVEELSRAEIQLETGKIEGEFEFKINARHWIDFLNGAEGETVELNVTEPNRAYLLQDNNYLLVAMPIID